MTCPVMNAAAGDASQRAAAEPAAVAARSVPKAGGRDLRMRDLLDALHEPVDAAVFQGADLTLKQFLQRLEDALARRGKGVPVVLDFEAFRKTTPTRSRNRRISRT
jgi:hypothetical protein